MFSNYSILFVYFVLYFFFSFFTSEGVYILLLHFQSYFRICTLFFFFQ